MRLQPPRRSMPPRRPLPRRGVTLVEMLVAVALLVLMMTVIVSVFSAATGSVSTARTYQELDDKLRQLDGTIRRDLDPRYLTATLMPTQPPHPGHNLGYFEYGENSYADLLGEDTDDYLRFTTKAPEGQYFTGRLYFSYNPANTPPGPQNQWLQQPVMIKSQYAEIIYFLRNGNLYRRVLLIVPDLQQALANIPGAPWVVSGTPISPAPLALGGNFNNNPVTAVSWLGMNDISARPVKTFNAGLTPAPVTIVFNTLGDLTNRENRFASPRFADDFSQFNATSGLQNIPDGITDDLNLDATTNLAIGDGIPDYYTSLFPQALTLNPSLTQPQLVYETTIAPRSLNNWNISIFDMAFPYIYPGAYSKPDLVTATNGVGWIHSPDPLNGQQSLAALNALNHAPLDLGDNLPLPSSPETWWGFPTWRETLAPFWTDPVAALPNPATRITAINGQPLGLAPITFSSLAAASDGSRSLPATWPPGAASSQWLPPMTGAFRVTNQLNTDGFGAATFAPGAASYSGLWNLAWEDDLILTNVRSFDVKAYDNAFAGYVDLGWGGDLRLYEPYRGAGGFIPNSPPYVGGRLDQNGNLVSYHRWPPLPVPQNQNQLPDPAGWHDLLKGTLAHEGRMPPLVNDFISDAQFPTLAYMDPNPLLPPAVLTLITNFNAKNLFLPLLGISINNVGTNGTDVIRLRRVWDSWSTDYSHAPATGFDPSTKRPIGPPFTPPVYPSYPAPYQAPLYGIQIQIRVVDPRNERVKVLTIRQDLSDKVQPDPNY